MSDSDFLYENALSRDKSPEFIKAARELRDYFAKRIGGARCPLQSTGAWRAAQQQARRRGCLLWRCIAYANQPITDSQRFGFWLGQAVPYDDIFYSREAVEGDDPAQRFMSMFDGVRDE